MARLDRAARLKTTRPVTLGTSLVRQRTRTRQFINRSFNSTSTSTATSSRFRIENGAGSLSGDTTGSVVDLFVGYNFQPSPFFVWGAQVEGTVFSDITLKSIGTRPSAATDTNTSTNAAGVTSILTFTNTRSTSFETTDDLRSMVALVGRAGWLATPGILIYGLGGATFGNFVLPDPLVGCVPGCENAFGGKRSVWRAGYTVGAGVEGHLYKNWSLRAEYRYLHFNINRDQSSSDNITTVTQTATATSTNPTESSLTRT